MKLETILLILCLFLINFDAKAKVGLSNSNLNRMTYGGNLYFEVKGCREKPLLKLEYKDKVRLVEGEALEFKKRYGFGAQIPGKIKYLKTSINCKNKNLNHSLHIQTKNKANKIGDEILSNVLHNYSPNKMKWDWGPAILLYGLGKYKKFSARKNDITHFSDSYFKTWFLKGLPKINWADKCAPALSLFELDKKDQYFPLIKQVVDYIKRAPKNKINSIDHFGSSWMANIFPGSIWVDSLMMWNLIAFKYGLQEKDSFLLNFSLEQPFIFAQKLRELNSGLMLHAWNVKKDRAFPKRNVPWLRGNGWVLTSIVEILEELPRKHKKRKDLEALFIDLAYSSKNYQLKTGLWDTLMASPGEGYQEISGSSLIAYAFIKGARLGLLDESFKNSAEKAFNTIVNRLIPNKKGIGWSVTGISWLTMPYSKLGYKMLPLKVDKDYGLGSFFLLLSEMARID